MWGYVYPYGCCSQSQCSSSESDGFIDHLLYKVSQIPANPDVETEH